MEKPNIVVLDGNALNPGDISWQKIADLGNLTVHPRTTPRQLLQRAAHADILLTNKVQITARTINALPRLKYIGVQATGYNVVDIQAAAQRNIPVCNIPAYSTPSVAQSAIAILLAITNRVEHYTQQARQGRWSTNPDFCYWDTPLIELANKRIGIVGLGHTGMATAHIASALGMEVCALTSKTTDELPPFIHKTTQNQLLETADIISLHCPLTPQTHHLIDHKTLSIIKPTAILINTGRGPLVDEQAVAHALTNSRLAAYGTDVMETEPPQADNPLLKAPNFFVTPHIAWATKQSRLRLMDINAANIQSFLNGRPQNVVNGVWKNLQK